MSFLKIPAVRCELILNTPERKEILNDGAPKIANCNILGKGAYGTVFKAIFRDRPVAVKVVKNHAGVNRTKNESHILGWKHRHIVRVLKVESTENFGIIIMEHFAGQSLQFVLDTMELPFVHRISISLDVLSALMYCHKNELLHLDVKPQNILIAFRKPNNSISGESKIHELRKHQSYICKLCDFGSSICIAEQQLGKTKAGGTIRYMSPEALHAEILSPATDIYSLGITMWQLQHRRVPYYQIQCNEVVAFQVVKHDLRPDSDFGHFVDTSNSGTLKSQLCLCQFNKTISSGIPKRHYLDVVNVKQILRRSCQSAKKACDLSQSISPTIRIGQQSHMKQSNIRNNAVRDLSKELEIDYHKRKYNVAISHNFLDIFCNNFCWKNDILAEKEQRFISSFKACWQSNVKKRPTGSELYKELMSLLK